MLRAALNLDHLPFQQPFRYFLNHVIRIPGIQNQTGVYPTKKGKPSHGFQIHLPSEHGISKSHLRAVSDLRPSLLRPKAGGKQICAARTLPRSVC